MGTQEQLQQDLKTALRAGDRQRVGVIRMVLAAIKTAQMAEVKAAYDAAAATGDEEAAAGTIDHDRPLDEAAVLDTLAKEIKRRREAAEMFRAGKRPELAENEEAEAAIIEAYLPPQLTVDELRPEVAATIERLGASGPSDMGKVMAALMQQYKGRADGKLISQLARELLSRQ